MSSINTVSNKGIFNLAKRLFCCEEFFEQLQDSDSKYSQLLDELTLMFILENLESKRRKRFLELLGDTELSSGNIPILFASRNIEDFEKRLYQFLKKSITKIGQNFCKP